MTIRVAAYGATVFLASALLLVLEIVAGRIIAPYVGASLYTWTSIIGVILAGLSLGNWLGGLWADRGGGHGAVGWSLALGALTSLASLLTLTWLAPVIQSSSLGLVGSSFVYVLALFFLPAVLLGIVTPLLTTLALAADPRTGHVVGYMHALAAVGSITGTFVTGFWLVQYVGTRGIVVGTAVVLLVLSVPYFTGVRRVVPVAVLVLALVLGAVVQVRGGFANPCVRESQYFCIRVADHEEGVPFGTARAMVLDHLLHGINHLSEPGLLIAPYVHLLSELVSAHFAPARLGELSYFFAGGGAYTHPRAVRAEHAAARVTVAELDPMVTRAAEEFMHVNTAGMEVHHLDARVALGRLPGPFDVVVTDVFHDISIPQHLLTGEFADLVKSRLVGDGLYLMNVVDAFPDPRLVKSIIKTLSRRFRHVDAWMEYVPTEPTRVTYVLSATDGAAPPEQLQARRGLSRTWYNVTEPLMESGTPAADLPALSDDFAPVERLIGGLLTGENR